MKGILPDLTSIWIAEILKTDTFKMSSSVHVFGILKKWSYFYNHIGHAKVVLT